MSRNAREVDPKRGAEADGSGNTDGVGRGARTARENWGLPREEVAFELRLTAGRILQAKLERKTHHDLGNEREPKADHGGGGPSLGATIFPVML